MRIPKRFKILGHTIEVVENPRLVHDHNWTGAASYREAKIELLPVTEATPSAPSVQEQTFCHELAHFLLYPAGAAINHLFRDKLYVHQQEEFVDLLGSLLHQALSTMEYED